MVGAVASGAPEAAPIMFIGWIHDIVILFALDKWQKELSGEDIFKKPPNKT